MKKSGGNQMKDIKYASTTLKLSESEDKYRNSDDYNRSMQDIFNDLTAETCKIV